MVFSLWMGQLSISEIRQEMNGRQLHGSDAYLAVGEGATTVMGFTSKEELTGVYEYSKQANGRPAIRHVGGYEHTVTQRAPLFAVRIQVPVTVREWTQQ
jgi:hypothetical protein